MHHKALLFGDEDIAARVLEAGHPRKVKELGRKVRNFNEETWARERLRIVYEGNVAKFSLPVSEEGLKRGTNNSAAMDVGEGGLKALLLSTGKRDLVEASPYDNIWGIGFVAKEAYARRNDWGMNLLGIALMAVRENFRKESKAEDGDA
jgi:predicted NAD-dependent protein-ADP-ribosyltransferase YbiA (DUF1768 family)